MSKHRKGRRVEEVPARAFLPPQEHTPTSYETFAALGVVLLIIVAIIGIAAAFGAVF